jgi:hypothetical protein
MLFTQTYTDGPLTFEADENSLTIDADGYRLAHIAGLPPHVAAHTAAAFNRAMQAVPDADAIGEGWFYTTKSTVWLIRCPVPGVYRAQCEEVTGDNDPHWMFVDANSLINLMDFIDYIEADEACDVCSRLVGADALTEHGDSLYCDDCAKTEAERERGLAEMAADDMAHSEMDRRAGL